MRPARRYSAKSSVTVASGPIMRSTEECEISRSCQSATFSSAGVTIAAHQAGKAGEVFGQHRIALVRHRRRALLARREELLGFQHLGALQMADFDREALDRRGDDAERRKEHRVAVARDDLRRDRLGLEAHLLGDMLFDARIDLREGADGAGDGAGRDFLARRDQRCLGARELGIGLARA